MVKLANLTKIGKSFERQKDHNAQIIKNGHNVQNC